MRILLAVLTVEVDGITTKTGEPLTPNDNIEEWCDMHEKHGFVPYIEDDGQEQEITWQQARKFTFPGLEE